MIADVENVVDVFQLHRRVVDNYSTYVDSFLSIADDEIRDFVRHKLIEERALWPDALIQLNPAYERAQTIAEQCDSGVLHPECGRIFRTDGESFRLYRHQAEAIALARRGRHYLVTSGTGSGKSLAYFIPIFDAVLRNNPARSTVRAIVVYPMNALVNSQELALKTLADRYRELTKTDMPVRFARYTGQESAAVKEALQKNPPHILLTNYVMLELMLVRPRERKFVDQHSTELQFLVFDELHTYRGRQGADVALLIRRLQERVARPALQCVGTSATMVSGDSAESRRQAVANFASKLFGLTITPDDVVEETLQRLVSRDEPPTVAALQAALQQGLPPEQWSSFAANPLSQWIEATFGVQVDADGALRRQAPMTLRAGAERLSTETGQSQPHCEQRLREMLLIGSRIPSPVDPRTSVFAFKLHQFISQGGSIFATLQPRAARLLTLEGQYYAPGKEVRLLYPLVFCRVCGQEYYTVRRLSRQGRLVPNVGQQNELFDDEDEAVTAAESGYVLIDPDGRWVDDESALPDHWLDNRGRLKPEYRDFRPIRQHIYPDGNTTPEPDTRSLAGWFVPEPFMLCLNCGEAYTRRDKHDFRKLARLSSEGRSTATTLLTLTTVAAMRDIGLDREVQKVLSFTDNRQDASLQAGHFNDFVQVALLRSALLTALQQYGELRFDHVAARVVEALGLDLEEYARVSDGGAAVGASHSRLDANSPQGIQTARAFRELIEYRLYDDLRRGWRVVQPNLEQVGLLDLGYMGLEELAADAVAWSGAPIIDTLPAVQRRNWLGVILDEMRRQLTIDVPCLQVGPQEELRRRVNEYVSEQWGFTPDETLRYASLYILPDQPRAPGDFSLSALGVIGRWLKGEIKNRLGQTISEEEYTRLITHIMQALARYQLVIEQTEGKGRQQRRGYRLRASALLWRLGSGAPTINPLRRYQARHTAYTDVTPVANSYFQQFYRAALQRLGQMNGAEHTAQIKADDRITREERFRNGDLAALFCSPTMELGVDISDLNTVHLRNVPPTPANYAQRSGRAGRAGQPALVLAYCAYGSGHDQYYFRNRTRMVAGSVAAPRLDLSNEDLIRAHMHAIWLARTGLDLHGSQGAIPALVDMHQLPDCPLLPEVQAQIRLSEAQQQVCLDQCRRVLESCGLTSETADWLDGVWLGNLIQRAAAQFDRAFDRWRELFRVAWAQFTQAQQHKQQAYMLGGTQKLEALHTANALEHEAQRQLNLLMMVDVQNEESDFYAYRYLASEGFLPGYNFPSLPVRAYLARGSDGEFVARPRFLALSEFGPDNIIYHNGAKYQVKQALLPLQEAEKRFVRAKLCRRCGYIHDVAEPSTDVCLNCGADLHDDGQYLESLLDMPTAKTVGRERITSDEEERMRRGYEVTLHFRYALDHGRTRRRLATARDTDGETLLALTYAPAATLWNINHRWKHQAQDTGFRLEMQNGYWVGQRSPAFLAGRTTAPTIRPNVRLFVHTSANALLLHIPAESEAFLATLQHALSRGIEQVYQVESNELSSERIGEGDRRAILFYESAEGGLGILRHLVNDSTALADIARATLLRLHFDPQTGEDMRPGEDEATGCAQACYDCLLSYYNQRDHFQLDRHLARDFLLRLTTAHTEAGSGERDYEAHYHALRAQTDHDSDLERHFLDHLYRTRRRLPDTAQQTIPELFSRPDFFYAPNVCVFCDGSYHDEPQQKAQDVRSRRELRDAGYRVIVVRYDTDLEAQIARHSDILVPT